VNAVSETHAEIKAKLLAGFDEYVERHEVILPSESPLRGGLRNMDPEECDWWCEARFTVIGWLQ